MNTVKMIERVREGKNIKGQGLKTIKTSSKLYMDRGEYQITGDNLASLGLTKTVVSREELIQLIKDGLFGA